LNTEIIGAATGSSVGSSVTFSFQAPDDAANLYFTWFPCEGKMDFSVSSPRFGDRTAPNTESTSVTFKSLSYQQVNAGDTFSITITNKWSSGSSIFNLEATTSSINTIEPGNDGKISTSFTDGKSTFKIEWTGTGEDSDTYSVWGSSTPYQGSSDFGQLLSACGVEDWMELIASDSEVSNNGNTFSYDIDLSNPNIPTKGSFTVIVSRAGALDGVYNIVTSKGVSGASILEIPKVVMFLLAAFLVAFFKF